jgi:ubiquinone/menaquinone biosynthesis C-methylase UbiE
VTDLQQDFRDLDRANDPQAGLRLLDTVGANAEAQEYKNLTFDMLELAPGQAVLDVGCGTGDDARTLATRAGPGGRVVGVDMSEAAIAEATRRSSGSGVPVEFRRGNALALEFPPDQFDRVRADRVFQHLEDPIRALRELVR